MQSLGGEKSAGIAKMPSDKKLERKEDDLDFKTLRHEFARFSARLFKEGHPFLETLRSDAMFQALKAQGGFDDESVFSTYALKYTDYIKTEFDLYDNRQQAALLAMLARLDVFQEDEMRRNASDLKKAA